VKRLTTLDEIMHFVESESTEGEFEPKHREELKRRAELGVIQYAP
jgi:hypothetical protein